VIDDDNDDDKATFRTPGVMITILMADKLAVY
jgi:hypothetical protein